MIVAGYPYLTESTFQSLQNIFGERVYIYDPFDYNLTRTFKNYEYPKHIKNDVINCSFIPLWKKFLWMPWLIAIFFNSKKWTNAVRKDIERMDPKTIIMITDLFPSSKIIENHFHKTKNLILLQPCLIDAWVRPDRLYYLRRLINKIFASDFLHKQQYWGLESCKSKLCLYDGEILNFFQTRRSDIEYIESPMKKFYLDNLLQKRTYKNTNEKLKIGIYPVDYSAIHGKSYQNELEKKYYDLCCQLKNEDIFVKIHPHEKIEYWQSRLPKGIEIIKEADKNFLYRIIDVHISTYSYSTIEAFFSGVYAINFEPRVVSKQGNLDIIFKNNSSEYTEKIQEIVYYVNKYKSKKMYEKKSFIERNLTKDNYNDAKTIQDIA